MADQAPESSKHVRRVIGFSRDLADLDLSLIEITTTVNSNNRAVTSVTLSHGKHPGVAVDLDRAFAAAFKELPGCDGVSPKTMSRTYEVEWDGICRPV